MANNSSDAPPADNILATVKARQRTLRLKRCGSPASATSATTVSTNVTSTTSQSTNHPSTTASTSSAGTKRTTPYGWTLEEKLFFFEALRLFGKNFPEVSRHIRRRVRRFSLTVKSREQCRLFYYRTWQYVKKHLRIAEEVPNLTMELYGLINYSVIYSRVKKKLNARLGEKLIELVQTGYTTLRFRGKRLVLRTPCCPSLKRLNGIEDPKQEYRVPDTLQVELTPRTSASFQRVQACAQNPSVRFLVSANRQLGEILSLLEAKWRSSLSRLRQELRLPVDDAPRLKVRLPEGTSLEDAVSVATVARCRYQDISLNAYLDRLHRSTSGPSVNSGVGPVLPQTASAPPPPPEDDPVRIELMEVGRLVLKGVDVEAARSVKILALYLALGCPPKIQLEYDYLSLSEMECSNGSRSPFTNAMRRLIHLCRSQQTTFKTMDEQLTKLKEERDNLASQLERVKRAPCTTCGCAPADVGSSGAGSTGSAGDSKGNGTGGNGTFRRPRAVYPKPSPSEQAARDKALRQLTALTGPRLTGVNGRAGSASIVVQRELQIDAHTEPELKPVCGVPAASTGGASEAAVLRDRARRQQPIIMHRNDRWQTEAASRMVAQQQLLQQQQLQQQQQQQQQQKCLAAAADERNLRGDVKMDVTCEGSGTSNGSNIIDRAFRIAMGNDNSVSHDSIDSLINKMGQSTPRHFPDIMSDKISYPPPTPPPAHLGDCIHMASPSAAAGGDSNMSALGSLLESPVKGVVGDTCDSQDSMVSRAVDAMMNENSVDYCRKFADLAERIVSADT